MNAARVTQKIFVSILAIFTFTNCSEKATISDSVKVKIAPNRPTVFNVDYEVSADYTATAPWFEFSGVVQNGADLPLEIIAIQVDVTGVNSNGAATEVTSVVSPSNFDHDNFLDPDEICEYTTFGIWETGETHALIPVNSTTGCVTDSNRDSFSPARIFITSNPTNEQENFRYRVKIQPVGFFLIDDPDFGQIPGERFSKSVSLSTR